MFYESFKTQKRKLRRAWEQAQKNSNEIVDQELINLRINNQLEGFLPVQEDLDRIIRFQTGWQEMKATGTGETRLTLRQNWEIELNPFQEQWIPFIKLEPIVRVGDGTISGDDNDHKVLTSSFFNKQIVFNIQDITDENGDVDPDNKIVLAQVSIWFAKSNDIDSLPQYQSNLFLEFHNPNEFV